VIWPTHTRSGLSGMILLACQCALALLQDLSNYQVPLCENAMLRLHIGIGAGEVAGTFLCIYVEWARYICRRNQQ
jgi:hypothetical protein